MKDPDELSQPARRWFEQLKGDWVFEDHELELLKAGADAWDRCRLARQQIDREWMTQRDKFNQLKVHPLLAVERDARAAVVTVLRALKFETGAASAAGELVPIADRQRRVRRRSAWLRSRAPTSASETAWQRKRRQTRLLERRDFE